VSVAPDELANLCAIFQQLNTRHLGSRQLAQRVADTLRIDTYVDATSIIAEAVSCELIRRGGVTYVVTSAGLHVGKSQSAVQSKITDRARQALLRHVYLNPKVRTKCCGQFIMSWDTDSTLGTFVYRRSIRESLETLTWLQTLDRVGLIFVDTERALIKREHLDAVNELLAEFRGAEVRPRGASGMLRQEIGDVGEELAIKYEHSRLRRSGHAALVPLVQRISLVDNSAGYDILSCRGYGHYPEARIYIEVKGTRDPWLQFMWSFNERKVAQEHRTRYWIYCFTDIDLDERSGKGPYRINNPVKKITSPEYRVEARDIFVKKA